MSTFLPVLLVVLAVLITGAILGQNAAPLGRYSYRWGVFLGAMTAAWCVFLFPTTVSSLRRGETVESGVMCLWVLSGIGGAVGLMKRSRFGAGLALAFYVQLALWPAVFMTVRGIPEEQQRSFATPVAILIVTNYVYFKKRWQMLS